MPGEQERDRLPFEPNKKRPKPVKNSRSPQPESTKKPEQIETDKKPERTPPYTKAEMAVPKDVSNRMARRMAVFCGVPTALGMLTFVVSYIVVSHQWFKLPHIAVLLVSMGFFGLSVLGLSYGILSASWDEQTPGSLLGWGEFKINWGRVVATWRSTRQKNV
ncbi:MAG: PAM68 family protein [Chroococcidiopsidaceae cyanobacterium CP_BM_ER_R8_30]|nr:PAM68 family protein [Chroococcidiopsidaceae cyanobacterium CP_BM_ER_R8_30]